MKKGEKKENILVLVASYFLLFLFISCNTKK